METPPARPKDSPALFVAVGAQGQRATSANGADWKNLQLGKEGEVYRAVCYGNGTIVAAGTFGGSNLFAASRDGTDWKTDKKDGQSSKYVRGLGFGGLGNGTFLALGGDPGAVGGSAPFVLTSPDGARWSDYVSIPGKNILRRFAWGQVTSLKDGNNDKSGDAGESGLFVAVGDRGRRAASADGSHWTDAPDVKAIDTLIDIAFGKPAGPTSSPTSSGIFVGVGLHGLRMTSQDGLKWSQRIPGEEGEHLNSVVWTGEQFVAVGLGGTYSSPDGLHWDRRDNHNAPLAVAYGTVDGKGLYVGTQWKGKILTSPDGLEWKQVYQADQHFEAICFGGGQG